MDRRYHLAPCAIKPNGEIWEHPTFRYVVPEAELAFKYPHRNFRYAKAGDYIGLVLSSTGTKVDFQITTNHPNMTDPAWLKRVTFITRVIAVQDKGEF